MVTADIACQVLTTPIVLATPIDTPVRLPSPPRRLSIEDSIDSDSDSLYEPTSGESSHSEDDNQEMITVSSVDPDDLDSTGPNIENEMPCVPRPLKRRKIAEPDAWKRNTQRKARLLNQPYSSTYNGKAITPKDIIPGCNCKKHCSDNFSFEMQRRVFDYYWSLTTDQAKRDFLVRRMKRERPARKLVESKSNKPKPRNWSYKYYFNDGIDGEIEVCQKFFRCTFGFPSDSQIRVVQKMVNEQGTATPKQPRGPPINKLSDLDVQSVRDHINSFPKMPSHFCRANSTVLYINSALNHKLMHAMYKTWLTEQNVQEVKYPSYKKYKEIFKTMNIRFHHNKKDSCKICIKSGKISGEQKLQYDDKILTAHLERKTKAVAEKIKDTDLSKSDKSVHTVTMDLQAILPCPVSKTSLTFYKRHIRCYNFTVYHMAEKRGYCYSWSEINGAKGTNEIASALYHYLTNYVPADVKRVILWSDGCGGQNRNSILSSALLRFVQLSDTIELIDQKYLEVGHTQMEVDTMHANIQNYRRRREIEIEIPHDWEKMFGEAIGDHGVHPYVVTKLGNHIMDFKPVADLLDLSKFLKKDKDFKWLKVVNLQYQKGEPDRVFYRKDLGDSTLSSVATVNSRPGRGRSHQESFLTVALQRAYTGQVPICSKNKKDMLQMIRDGVIDECHTSFYSQLIADDDIPEEAITDQVEWQENELNVLEEESSE